MNEKILNKRLPQGKLSWAAQTKFLFKLFGTRSERQSEVQNNSMKKKTSIALGLAIVVIAFVALSSYAYASPTVTAHDSLFALKKAGENLKVAFASPLGKVKAYVDIAGRRLEEFKYLTGEEAVPGNSLGLIKPALADDEYELTDEEEEIDDTLEMMNEATENSMNAVEGVEDPEDVEEAAQIVEETQEEQEEALEEALEGCDENRDAIKEKIAIKLEGLRENREAMREAKQAIFELMKENMDEIKLAIKTITEEEGEIDEEKIKELLDEIKAEIALWKEEVLSKVENGEVVEGLFTKIDDRILKIEEAIENGELPKSLMLLKSTRALRNNAWHFVKGNIDKEKIGEAVSEFKNIIEEIRKDFKDGRIEIRGEFKDGMEGFWNQKKGTHDEYKERLMQIRQEFKENIPEGEIKERIEQFRQERQETHGEFLEKMGENREELRGILLRAKEGMEEERAEFRKRMEEAREPSLEEVEE